jgi:two-component system, NarL family, nitrate/nitrite response regulator NarL
MKILARPKIKILLVDDHPFLREGIRSYLSSQDHFEIVGEVGNGHEAIVESQKLHPDVVVMDISMPVMNGLEATRYLRKYLPTAKVLILSMHEQEEFTTQIIEAGARGYLPKNCDPDALITAIECVHAGETFFTGKITETFIRSYVQMAGKPHLTDHDLSLRERQVLTLIAEGLSSKEAASLLGISVRTVEKHRERIMSKLKLHSVVELTKYAIAKQMIQVRSHLSGQ